jgi:hypothetical protein
MKEPDHIVWPMYTDVNRLKQVFRHIEGISIPLPIPITITAICVGVLSILLALLIPWGEPLTKYVFMPLVLMCVVSYIEPDQVSPIAWVYGHIRRWIKPRRRVMNRAVPSLGYGRIFVQYSVIRKGKKEELT